MAEPIAYGIDYASGTIPGSTIAATRAPNGDPLTFAIRYVTSQALANPPGHNQKHITPAEYASHRAAGVRDLYVFQGSTTDADGGYSAGQRNARLVLAGWAWIGATPDICFFTNDRTELPNPSAWKAYLDGAASILGRDMVGAYGFGNAIDAAVGHATYFWQSGRESDLRPHVHIYQWNNGSIRVGNQTCDLNKMYHPVGGTDLTPEEHEMLKQVRDVLGSAYDPQTGVDAGTRLKNIDKAIGDAYDSATDTTLGDRMVTMEAAVAKLQGGGIDLDALADRVAARLAAAQATATADEIDRRWVNRLEVK